MRQPTRSLRVASLLAAIAGLISTTTQVTRAQSVTIWPGIEAPQSVSRGMIGRPGTNGGTTLATATFKRETLSRSFTTAAASPQSPLPPACPCSIWNPLTTTPTNDDGDASAVELGVRFRSDIAGYVTGLRFYKFAGNTGFHIGNLWSNTGTLLARANFTGETASGWQQVTFSPPVIITANTTYVASYHTDAGHYASSNGFFNAGVDNAPLHALRDGVDGPNGVYRYGTTGFPNQTFQARELLGRPGVQHDRRVRYHAADRQDGHTFERRNGCDHDDGGHGDVQRDAVSIVCQPDDFPAARSGGPPGSRNGVRRRRNTDGLVDSSGDAHDRHNLYGHRQGRT